MNRMIRNFIIEIILQTQYKKKIVKILKINAILITQFNKNKKYSKYSLQPFI